MENYSIQPGHLYILYPHHPAKNVIFMLNLFGQSGADQRLDDSGDHEQHIFVDLPPLPQSSQHRAQGGATLHILIILCFCVIFN